MDDRLLPVYRALAARDMVGLQRLVSPDVVLHVAGESGYAGTYEGLGPVLGLASRLENRIAPGASEFERSDDDGDRLTATVRVTLRTAWGDLRSRLFESFRFGPENRIEEMWVEAEDQLAFDVFLDRLGRPD